MSDQEQEKPKTPGLKFDGTIHLGHVLVFVGMVGSVLSLYTAFVSQNERTNYRLDSMERVIMEQGTYNKGVLDVLNKLQINQAIVGERLNRLDPRSRNAVPEIPQ
jgi:hypothetical protein